MFQRPETMQTMSAAAQEHIPRLNALPLALHGPPPLPPLDDPRERGDGDPHSTRIGPRLGAFTMEELLWTFRPVDPLTLHGQHGCRLFERQERSFFARPGREIIRAGYHPEDAHAQRSAAEAAAVMAAAAHRNPPPQQLQTMPGSLPLPVPPAAQPLQQLSTGEMSEREGASYGAGASGSNTPARNTPRGRGSTRRGGGGTPMTRRRRRTGPDQDAAESAGVAQGVVDEHYAEERRNAEAKAQLAAAYAAALQGSAGAGGGGAGGGGGGGVRLTYEGATASGPGVHVDSRGNQLQVKLEEVTTPPTVPAPRKRRSAAHRTSRDERDTAASVHPGHYETVVFAEPMVFADRGDSGRDRERGREIGEGQDADVGRRHSMSM